MRLENRVDIEIIHAEALTFHADVLIMKHAGDLYGLDEEVVRLAAIDPRDLPPPDRHQVFLGAGKTAARHLLFVGTVSILAFSYRDVRRFGHAALRALSSSLPDASHVALTLHGPGFGLDELECFDAEIGGLADALLAGDAPHALRTISVVELDAGRVRRLNDRLTELLGPNRGTDPRTRHLLVDPGERLRTAGSDTYVKNHAFVAMPFAVRHDDTFHYGISSAVHSNGLLCQRVDQQPFVGDVLERLKTQITSAKLVVADLTGSNPNVFLEIGYAWGTGVPTILVCAEGEALKFDVQGQRCLFYKSIRHLEESLTEEIQSLLPSL